MANLNSGFGALQSHGGAPGGFGNTNTGGFGAPAPSGFGGTGETVTRGAFGAPAVGNFGNAGNFGPSSSSSAGGGFGNVGNTGNFGPSSSSSTGGGFGGAASTGGFGPSSSSSAGNAGNFGSSTGGFGAPASTGSGRPLSSGFGGQGTTTSFGAAAAQPTSSDGFRGTLGSTEHQKYLIDKYAEIVAEMNRAPLTGRATLVDRVNPNVITDQTKDKIVAGGISRDMVIAFADTVIGAEGDFGYGNNLLKILAFNFAFRDEVRPLTSLHALRRALEVQQQGPKVKGAIERIDKHVDIISGEARFNAMWKYCNESFAKFIEQMKLQFGGKIAAILEERARYNVNKAQGPSSGAPAPASGGFAPAPASGGFAPTMNTNAAAGGGFAAPAPGGSFGTGAAVATSGTGTFPSKQAGFGFDKSVLPSATPSSVKKTAPITAAPPALPGQKKTPAFGQTGTADFGTSDKSAFPPTASPFGGVPTPFEASKQKAATPSPQQGKKEQPVTTMASSFVTGAAGTGKRDDALAVSGTGNMAPNKDMAELRRMMVDMKGQITNLMSQVATIHLDQRKILDEIAKVKSVVDNLNRGEKTSTSRSRSRSSTPPSFSRPVASFLAPEVSQVNIDPFNSELPEEEKKASPRTASAPAERSTSRSPRTASAPVERSTSRSPRTASAPVERSTSRSPTSAPSLEIPQVDEQQVDATASSLLEQAIPVVTSSLGNSS